MSETDKPELLRIAKDDYEFRVQVLTSQARLEQLIESHMDDDKRQFRELRSRLGSVTSSVGQVRSFRDRIGGMSSLLIVGGALVMSFAGLVLSLIEHFWGKQ